MRPDSNGRRSLWKIIAAAALAGVTPPGAGAAQAFPPTDRARGLVWDGLAPGRVENRCDGAYEIRGRADEVLGCTHGPDAATARPASGSRPSTPRQAPTGTTRSPR